MRLATRTGLAAFAAASVSLLAIGVVLGRTLPDVLQDQVDQQLDERAATAPILAAVADRLARSELTGTVEGARVLADGSTTQFGFLPEDPLPPIDDIGFRTVSADGQRWRLLTIEVVDVPQPGDAALVQLVAPLGDVDAQVTDLRRRALLIGLFAASVAGLVGFALGRRATRPLSALRSDADRFDDADPVTWAVGAAYGSPEVDDVADALNASLARLVDESRRRNEALDAARAFASSASHELRTPLQSTLTNIDIARSPLAGDDDRAAALDLAHQQLQRMAAGLSAVRAIADAEFADLQWFVPSDLGDVVDAAVADESRGAGVEIGVTVEPGPAVPIWRDGVRLAIANVVRNAIVHGGDPDTGVARITVAVSGTRVTIDDAGGGIPVADRERVLRRFERGGRAPGSGLGLAIAAQVALAHGGGIEISDAPAGGTRVVLRFGP